VISHHRRTQFQFCLGAERSANRLLKGLDMVIVTTADPFFGKHSIDSWAHESAIMNMVGGFIASLPNE